MKVYEFGEGFKVICDWKKTRVAFKHVCDVVDKGGNSICSTKICYLNRTWERYEYQSVIHQAIGIAFGAGGRRKNTPEQEARIKAYCDEVDDIATGQLKKQFNPVKMAVAFGSLISETKTEKNAFTKRMLNTIPGVDFPEDFDQLSEEEKERRMDEALKVL